MSGSKSPISNSKSIDPNQGEPLLFINKDATNLKRTAEEVFAVGSHVSRGSRKWRRPPQSLLLDPSTGAILASAGFSTTISTPEVGPVGKSVRLRWRVQDGRVTSTKTIGGEDKWPTRTRNNKNQSVSPSGSESPETDISSTMTPFTSPAPSPEPQPIIAQSSSKSLIQFYLDVIRPFALTITRSWLWVEDVFLIDSSPALSSAVCAFTSAFRSITCTGRKAVALPPSSASGLLWPVPEWFTHHAQAISLLRENLETITASEKPIYKAELHAMLFLMRLQILLGDHDVAMLHFHAIRQATQHATIVPDLQIDLAMWKIDMAMIYQNPAHVAQQTYVRAEDPLQQQPLFYIRNFDSLELGELPRQIADKTVLWQGIHFKYEAAFPSLIEDCLMAECGFTDLSEQVQRVLRSCLYISRYLLAYLRYMSADTSQPMVRQVVRSLNSSVSSVDEFQADLWRQVPRLMFYIMFTGVFASHEHRQERGVFVKSIQMNLNCEREDSCDHARSILSWFLDLSTVNEGLFQIAWENIVNES